jgi:hypothetical protein
MAKTSKLPSARLVIILCFQFILQHVQPLAIQKFIESKGGTWSPKLDVVEFPGMGLGFQAKELIRPAETLLVIPQDSCFVSQHPDPLTDLTIKLALAKRQGSANSLAPFVEEYLSGVESHLPMAFSDEKLAALEGTLAGADAVQMRNDCLEALASLRNGIIPTSEGAGDSGDSKGVQDPALAAIAQGLSEEEWLHARASVQCRAVNFRPQSEDGPPVTALVPGVTIANHDDKVFCSVKRGNGYTVPEDCFVIQSPDHCSYYPGQQVCISYGDLSFTQKFLSFGWVDTAAAAEKEPELGRPSKPMGRREVITAVSIQGCSLELKTALPPPAAPSNRLQNHLLSEVAKISGETGVECKALGEALQAALLERRDSLVAGEPKTKAWPELAVVRQVETAAVDALLAELQLLDSEWELGCIVRME